MTRILIVDDEEGIRSSLVGILGDEGMSAHAVGDGAAALADLAAHPDTDLVLLDIAMPGRDGVSILAELRERWPELPVVMMSGHGSIEIAVRCTRLGAFDFVEKPLTIEKLLLTVEHAVERVQLERENARLRAARVGAAPILGASEPIVQLVRQIERAAPTSGWALITGENGTGKELVARQLHVRSQRSRGPFVAVNCAAIPEELIESELFGHEKGAFTGAVSRKRGKFELADGGSLFLDEVADMSLMTQAKVLRILQENSFERVGGTEPIKVDVRVIAATNRDLQQEIAAGRFREDLYYRLNVLPFRVPSLRERPADIPILARAFVAEFCAEAGSGPMEISERAMDQLLRYPWPGNVRELRNLMERLVIMAPGAAIDDTGLPAAGAAPAPGGAETLDAARRRFEREFLAARLAEHDGNISRTAESVGIKRETLSRKLKQLGVAVPRG